MKGGRGDPSHFDVRRVGPGAWAAIARDGGYALCNSGIFDLGRMTVVFDTMLTPVAGAKLALAARRLTGRPPDVVVNSHWHGDHIRGNVAFRPAPIASTQRTRELILTRGREQWTSDLREMPGALRELDAADQILPAADRTVFRGWFQGTLAVRRPFRPIAPDLTFDRKLTIFGERRELRLVSYGGGHSPSDVFAFEPDGKIACLGDLLSIGYHPSAGDGNPRSWAAMLARIRRLRTETAIPGHGAVGGAADLAKMERYLRGLVRTARSARRSRRSRAEMMRTPPPEEFHDWTFAGFYSENLARAFAQSK
ncbi:MAG: MBL fold metallo-hydrolase [Thermoplasmata archaeon]|nr:MBL fold metallo-hydrolase [Thermoplasmata archaeon]MCI4355747.1 MBL fold metallo-hydrolase [Thermoplasmata archaeon]